MKLILITFVLICLFLANKSKNNAAKKSVRLLVCFSFALLVALAIGNADYAVYKEAYKNAISLSSTQFEKGYTFAMFMFNAMGFSYESFLFIMSFLAYLLITSTVYKYSYKPELVMAMYVIFPFAFDATQTRNFFAMALLVYAIRFIVERKDLWWIKYLIFVFIATLFHNIALIFLAIPMFMIFKKHYKVVLPIFILGGLLFVYSPLLEPTVNFATNLLFGKNYAYFFERPGIGLFVPIFEQVLIIFLIFYQRRLLANNTRHNLAIRQNIKNKVVLESTRERYNTQMKSYFIASLVLVVGYAVTSHATRVLRDILILAFIAIGNVYYKLPKRYKRGYLLMTAATVALISFIECYKYVDYIIIPLFF